MGGPNFYEIPVEEMLRLFHFQPVGSSTTAVKELRIQQIMQLYSLARDDPFFQQHELRKRLLTALDFRDYDKLLYTDEQVEQKQKQMMMAQAQAAAMAKGQQAEEGSAEGAGQPAVVGGENQGFGQMLSEAGEGMATRGRGVTSEAGTEAEMI